MDGNVRIRKRSAPKLWARPKTSVAHPVPVSTSLLVSISNVHLSTHSLVLASMMTRTSCRKQPCSNQAAVGRAYMGGGTRIAARSDNERIMQGLPVRPIKLLRRCEMDATRSHSFWLSVMSKGKTMHVWNELAMHACRILCSVRTLCLRQYTGKVFWQLIIAGLPEWKAILFFGLKRLAGVDPPLVKDTASMKSTSETCDRFNQRRMGPTHLLTPNWKNSDTICADPLRDMTFLCICAWVCIWDCYRTVGIWIKFPSHTHTHTPGEGMERT